MTPADIAAIRAKAESARALVRPRRECGECGLVNPPAETCDGAEFHIACPRAGKNGQYAVTTVQSYLGHDEATPLADGAIALADALAAAEARAVAAERALAAMGHRERETANECAMLRAVAEHAGRGERDDRVQWKRAAAKYLAAHGHEATCATVQHPGHPYEGCNCVVEDIERGCMGDVVHALIRARAA